MKSLILPAIDGSIHADIFLPSSKSVSNRVLVIRALCDDDFEIHHLSNAEDTSVLAKIIDDPSDDIFCGAGGTTLRFFLALCAAKNMSVKISGTDRLNKRPLKPLLDALVDLGLQFEYHGKPFFPPLKIVPAKLVGRELMIKADVSSQFISALMLIAPTIENGVVLHLDKPPVSFAYIQMTATLMEYFNVNVIFSEDKIIIPPQKYIAKPFTVPADWSNAAYWFGVVAINPNLEVMLKNTSADHLQGDVILLDWMKLFGVNAEVIGDDLRVYNDHINIPSFLHLNLMNHPDLAQPLAVVAAALGVDCLIEGLSTLKLKETDRITAVKTELEKVGVAVEATDDSMHVTGKINRDLLSTVVFDTYDDHRMAMSLAMLSALNTSITINDPEVVNKSYPGFFDELMKLS